MDEASQVSYGLADTPKEGQRPFHDAGDVLAPGLILQEEAGRRLDHVLERGLVEPSDRRLLLVERLGLEPGRHLRFDLWHVRPTEPGLVAIGAYSELRGIDAVRAGKPRVEHLPAALAGRGLDGAPRADRGPVN